MFSRSLTQIRSKFSQIRSSSLVKDSFWLLVSKGLGIFIQTAYFVVLTRTLGATEYGIFVGISALATMVNSFASWGSSEILVKYVSVDRSLLKYYWGNALVTVLVMGIFLTAAFTILGPILLNDAFDPLIIALIFIADLIGFNIGQAANTAFITVGKAKITAFTSVLTGFTKLLAAILLALVLEQTNAVQWAYLYCFSTMLPAIISMWMVNAWLDKPRPSIPRLKKELVQGFYFSTSQSADFINENIDKVMLSNMASLQATGLYGAGFRVLTVFRIPILSVASATFPRFFRHGAEGIEGGFKFARKLLPMAFAYGLLAALIIFSISPYVEVLIGEGYAEIDTLLKLLAPVPLLVGLQILVGDTLTGSNHQRHRTSIQVFAAALNVMLNLWLIPRYSWQGAAWATLISESTKVVGFSIAILYLCKK